MDTLPSRFIPIFLVLGLMPGIGSSFLPKVSAIDSFNLEPPPSVQLYGWTKDSLGNPLAAAIYVNNEQGQVVADFQTDASGYYDVTVPGSTRFFLVATPLWEPGSAIDIGDGSLVSKYFELTKTIVPKTESIEIDFHFPPAAALWMQAYNLAGSRMLMGEFYERINPSGYSGFQNIYGVFPLSSFSIPVPTEASIGMLRAAWQPALEWNQQEPCFGVPPGEPFFIMMIWEVPGIGTFPLRADNQGQGYNLAAGGVLSINLVYEFAETEHRRTLELKAGYEADGIQFLPDVTSLLDAAGASLAEARGHADGPGKALHSYDVLSSSIDARERMTMQAAAVGIEDRKSGFTIGVQDEAGIPIAGATVTYDQTRQDFILGYAQGHPVGIPYPSFKAGRDIGYESLYGAVVWKKVSPQMGVFDFSSYDAEFKHWQDMGYEVNACLGWLYENNVPDWALGLDFTTFKQQMAEFVRQTVAHFSGTIKFLNVATEVTLLTYTGSRYVSMEFESNYLTGVQPAELIDLIKTAFQAAQEVNSEIKLGIYGVADFNPSALNPHPRGGWPPTYSFLKAVLESGVQPDYIGVELYPATLSIPLDLATYSAILQAYHDMSGLPVLITETVSYSSRAEDYGEIGPTPEIYWHEGLTQSAQAEFDSAVFKLSLALPFILGVHMFHGMPDNFEPGPGHPWGNCMGIPACIGNGIDTITMDYQPKQVYYATADLFDSLKASGSVTTDADGKVSFKGLGGTYAVTVTRSDGLRQDYKVKLNSGSPMVIMKLDHVKALADLQTLVEASQKAIDWSQNLGRLLDFNSLRLQLAEARSAIVNEDYSEARAGAQSILDTTTIQIDGDMQDWMGIQPIATAPQGGVAVDAPGIDLKALYGMRDENYLYLMVEVYDPPITLQPGGNLSGFQYPQFLFDMETGPEKLHHIRTYLPYTGEMGLYRISEPSGYLTTLFSIARGDVLELKVPLALLDAPTQVTVCGFVMAAKDGVGTGAKAFPCYVEAPYPIFSDVTVSHWAHVWIERLYRAGITTGCIFTPTLQYCPEQAVTRAQMAVFLIRATHGVNFIPNAPTGIFTDVPPTAWAANYIEQLYADGITTGCSTSPLMYCPSQSVTRAEMAKFLLRAKHGSAYNPPDPVGIFSDVPTTHWAAKWIEQLYAEGITTGCSTSPLLYCPEQPVTRAQMAAFLVRTFGLP